jgi:type I restriction enzyme S subunit
MNSLELLADLIGPVPVGWRIVRIGEVLKEVSEPIRMHDSEVYRLVSIGRRNTGMFHRDDVLGRDILTKDLQRVIPGSFVIARRQIVHGACALATTEFGDAAVSSSYSLFVGRDDCEIRFFAWLAKHPFMYRYFMDASHGIVIEKLNFDVSRWLSYPVYLPPLREQLAIVEALDAADVTVQATERLIAKREGMLQAMLTTLFGLKDERRAEDNVPLGEIGEWRSGGTPNTSNPKYWSGAIPWISASSLRDIEINDSDRRLTAAGVLNGTRVTPKGSVVFVVRGMSLKSEFRVGVTCREVAFSQDCRSIVPISTIDPYFLAYSLKAATPQVLRMVDETSHGTGRLDGRMIKRLSLAIPPIEEQRRLVSIAHSVRSEVNELRRILRKQVLLRQGLMHSLLSGGSRFDQESWRHDDDRR